MVFYLGGGTIGGIQLIADKGHWRASFSYDSIQIHWYSKVRAQNRSQIPGF